MSARFAWALPFGAACRDDGAIDFRLWAPDQNAVELELGNGRGVDVVPMEAEGDGWFAHVCEAAPGTRYRFRLDDGSAVPDPASRWQPDGVDGPSAVVAPNAFRWSHDDWRGRPWREAVIYELHVGACGGYRGVIAQLPRLAALGITAIELMPVAQGPGRRNWGYDGVLPFAPTCAYGSPDDLKALVDAAHGHGLMVFLDVVYNHFGPHGNHIARYASRFFRGDRHTPWGDAIDFRQPQVREYFIHNALYWLHEYRFDGLRLDAVHAIDDSDFLLELARRVHSSVAAPRQIHLVLENDHNDATLLQSGYTAQWNDDAHHVLHRALTGEDDGYYADYSDPPAADLARWLREGFVYQGQPSSVRDGAPRGQPSAQLPTTAFVVFLQNHDQVGNRALGERLTTLADPQALRAATALLLLSPQVPLLFMGEEWGSTQRFLYFTDYATLRNGELATAVREGRRREFAGFAGFDGGTCTAIPDPNAAETFRDSVPDFAAAAQPGAAADRQRWTQRLLSVRRGTIVPRLDRTRALQAQVLGPAAVSARWRLGDGSVLRIDVNLGKAAVPLQAQPLQQVLFELEAGQANAVAGGSLPGAGLVAQLEERAG